MRPNTHINVRIKLQSKVLVNWRPGMVVVVRVKPPITYSTIVLISLFD